MNTLHILLMLSWALIVVSIVMSIRFIRFQHGQYTEHVQDLIRERLGPASEYDFTNVIHLTHNKAQHIIERDGYVVTGFVLTKNKEGREYSKCIVDMSAVRWFDDGMTFFRMMHSDTPEEWKGKGVFE